MPGGKQASFLALRYNIMMKLFLSWVAIVGLTCWFLLVLIIGTIYFFPYYQFKKNAQISDKELFGIIKEGWQSNPSNVPQMSFLILGIDSVSNRAGDPVLTDTILLGVFDLKSSQLKLVSLPRDLWIPEYQTKVNALYEYGKERYQENPERFSKEVIQELSKMQIQYTFVISLEQLKEFIDILGGVEVEITAGFIDEEFPRSDVDIRTEKDPAKLYERIEFVAGKETMSGERALKYIRSRHSTDLEAGTDDARSQRQQAVIQALIAEFKKKSTLTDFSKLGKVFHWYRVNFEKIFPTYRLISLGKTQGSNILNVSFQPQQFKLSLTEDSTADIIHPPVRKYGQWVYEVRDITAFRQSLYQKLDLKPEMLLQ
jgi:LCP family protein required for cell wall assembly